MRWRQIRLTRSGSRACFARSTRSRATAAFLGSRSSALSPTAASTCSASSGTASSGSTIASRARSIRWSMPSERFSSRSRRRATRETTTTASSRGPSRRWRSSRSRPPRSLRSHRPRPPLPSHHLQSQPRRSHRLSSRSRRPCRLPPPPPPPLRRPRHPLRRPSPPRKPPSASTWHCSPRSSTWWANSCSPAISCGASIATIWPSRRVPSGSTWSPTRCRRRRSRRGCSLSSTSSAGFLGPSATSRCRVAKRFSWSSMAPTPNSTAR